MEFRQSIAKRRYALFDFIVTVVEMEMDIKNITVGFIDRVNQR